MMKRFAILATLALSVFSAHAEEEKAIPHTITLEVLPIEGADKTVNPEAFDSAVKKIKQRLKKADIANSKVVTEGSKISVSIPKILPSEAQSLSLLLSAGGQLTIHKRHANHTDKLAKQVFDGEKIIPGARSYPQQIFDEEGALIDTRYVLIDRRPALTGKDIERTSPNYQTNTEVLITLTPEGAKKMEKFTRSLTPGRDHIVSVFDGKVMNDAVLNAEVLGKNFVISGLDNIEECERLSEPLATPLENEVKVISITPSK